MVAEVGAWGCEAAQSCAQAAAQQSSARRATQPASLARPASRWALRGLAGMGRIALWRGGEGEVTFGVGVLVAPSLVSRYSRPEAIAAEFFFGILGVPLFTPAIDL